MEHSSTLGMYIWLVMTGVIVNSMTGDWMVLIVVAAVFCVARSIDKGFNG